MLDYYQILQVSENASMEEVRVAYKKRLAEVESYGLTKSEKKELIYKIKVAFEVIGHDTSRMAYDISWENNPARKIASSRAFYSKEERSFYRTAEGYNKNENARSHHSKGESLFSRLFQRAYFQWILAFGSIFGLILIVTSVVFLVKKNDEENQVELRFRQKSIEKVQTDQTLSQLESNLGFGEEDLDSITYGLSKVNIQKYKLDKDEVLRPIQSSNALALGLDSARVHQFFNKWKGSHCYSSSRLNIATYYAMEIESDNEEYSKEEFRLRKVALFKTWPYYLLGISSTVAFQKIDENLYSMLFVKFVKTDSWAIVPGYIEFEVLPDKIQITREDFIYTR